MSVIDVGLFAAWLTLLSGCRCEYYYILLHSPSTDDCKYSTPVSLSVSDQFSAMRGCPPLCFVLIKTLLTAVICPIARLSSNSVSFETTDAWCIPWISLIGPRVPSVKLTSPYFIYLFLPVDSLQNRNGSFSVAFHVALFPVIFLFCFVFVLGLWWGDSDSVHSCCVFIHFLSLLFAHLNPLHTPVLIFFTCLNFTLSLLPVTVALFAHIRGLTYQTLSTHKKVVHAMLHAYVRLYKQCGGCA